MSSESRSPDVPLLRLDGVVKRYPGATDAVLRGVDLEVDVGELVGICGASGAGKTTLLNLLGCLDRPSAGRLCFDGLEVDQLDGPELDHLRSARIGFVFQQCHLLAHLTVGENLEVRWLYGDRPVPSDLEQRKSGALARLGLSGFERRWPQELSGGEMQRVALARAILADPDLILADEPTGNLDERHGEEVFEQLTEIAAGGAAVLLVTHNAALWSRCRRRMELAEGRLREVA